MALMRVRLELARDHDFPSGSPGRRYDFAAQLDGDGHIDAAEWKENRRRERFHKF